MSFVSSLLKNRQQIVNGLIVTISINMYVQNEKINKQWSALSIKENQLKKDYDCYEKMVNDSDWLEAVEERIIKSSNKKSVNNKNISSNSYSSIIKEAIYERIPSFNPNSESVKESNTNQGQ